MKSLVKYTLVLAASIAVTACGGKKDKEVTENSETLDLTDYAPGHAVQMSDKIDSLALNADDLSPEEAVNVLLAYVEIEQHAENSSAVKMKRETMRKFTDVYDIVMSNHGNDFRSAIDKARRSTELDLSAIASDYRERLADYDEGAGVESAPVTQKEKPDSVVNAETTAAAASVQTEQQTATVSGNLFD